MLYKTETTYRLWRQRVATYIRPGQSAPWRTACRPKNNYI